MGRSTAKRAHTARRLHRLPVTQAAWLDGSLSTGQVQAIVANVDDRTIDSHVKRLRKKFKAADSDFAQIETLYGIGYRYRDA